MTRIWTPVDFPEEGPHRRTVIKSMADIVLAYQMAGIRDTLHLCIATEDAAPVPYSHRNGEMIPPTEAGFFWFIGRKRKHSVRVSKGGVYRVWWNSGELYTRIEPWSSCLVDELVGRWYGPVTPPWQAQPSEAQGKDTP